MNISRIVSSTFFLLLIFFSTKSQLIFNLFLINFLSFLCFWEFFRLLNFKNLQKIHKSRTDNFFLTRSKITSIDFFQIILLQISVTFYTFEKLILSVSFFLLVLFLNMLKKYYKVLNFFGTIYLITPFICAFNFYDDKMNLLLFVLVISVATDTGGYYFGKNLNGPKIFPLISPNKTWAGFIGGILLTILIFFLIFKTTVITNYIFLSIIILFSVVCQIGDFIESYFKRFCNVKDSSNIIPGHGGVLDRIDSIFLLLTVIFTLNIFNFNFLENFMMF